MEGEGGAVEEWEEWFLILLFFCLWCLLSNPVHPTLVWVHKHSTPCSFPCNSALCQPAPSQPQHQPFSHEGSHSPRGLTHTDTQTLTCAQTQTHTVEPATQAAFSNQHTFHAACGCLLPVFVIQEEGERTTKKWRFTAQITCGNLTVWIPKKGLISIHSPLVDAAREGVCECARCVLLLPQQQPLLLVGNRTAGELLVWWMWQDTKRKTSSLWQHHLALISAACALWNGPWLAENSLSQSEYRAKGRCRSLVFFQTTWITKCWKVIVEFLPNDTKIKLPTPALIRSCTGLEYYSPSSIFSPLIKQLFVPLKAW